MELVGCRCCLWDSRSGILIILFDIIDVSLEDESCKTNIVTFFKKKILSVYVCVSVHVYVCTHA